MCGAIWTTKLNSKDKNLRSFVLLFFPIFVTILFISANCTTSQSGQNLRTRKIWPALIKPSEIKRKGHFESKNWTDPWRERAHGRGKRRDIEQYGWQVFLNLLFYKFLLFELCFSFKNLDFQKMFIGNPHWTVYKKEKKHESTAVLSFELGLKRREKLKGI